MARFMFYGPSLHPHPANIGPHSFPTRRSSDLSPLRPSERARAAWLSEHPLTTATDTVAMTIVGPARGDTIGRDRKSTRLNSSHRCISYAVLCLKKKIEVLYLCFIGLHAIRK